MSEFNLINEKWIPVLYHDGRLDRVGIQTAFTKAGDIRQIAASNPMDRVAVLRFLLAVLYWCLGNPKEEQAGFDAEAVSRKLEENQDCFNLLGEGKRFYQVQGNRRSRPTTDLYHEFPTDFNLWHFRHIIDGNDGLCPVCCTLGLLRLPIFTQIAGQGGAITRYLYGGIHGSPPIFGFWQDPSSLQKTLLINWQPMRTIGKPNWDSAHLDETSADSSPLLFGLTHLPRMVWLGEIERGVCVNCGLYGVIKLCNIESPGKNEDEKWSDPHTILSEEGKTEKAPDPFKRFTMDKQWIRLLGSLVSSEFFQQRPQNSPSLTIVAFAADKAKKVDTWEREIDIKSVIDTIQFKSGLSQWDEESKSRVLRRMRNAIRMKIRPREVECDIRSTSSAIRPHIEHVVSQRIGGLLGGGEETWQKAANEYTPFMQAAAQSLSPGVTIDAVERRHQIAQVKPDMRPREEKPAKQRKVESDE